MVLKNGHLLSLLSLLIAATSLSARQTGKGVWISQGEGSAFVSIEPTVAVTRFQPAEKSPALLHEGEGFYNTGIRTWIMENDRSFEHNASFSKTPGKIIAQDPHRVVVSMAWREIPDRETGLELEVELLKPNVLRIRHTITNLAAQPRRLAPWSIAAFGPPGFIGLPLMEGPYRPMVLFDETDGAFLAGNLGRKVFSIDLAQENYPHPSKIGVHFPGGWGFFLRENWLWISHVPYKEGQIYPEGGANLTTYRSKDSVNHSSWGELEHVGVTRICRPGESVSIIQTVVLTTITSDHPDFTTIAERANAALAETENHSNH